MEIPELPSASHLRFGYPQVTNMLLTFKKQKQNKKKQRKMLSPTSLYSVFQAAVFAP